MVKAKLLTKITIRDKPITSYFSYPNFVEFDDTLLKEKFNLTVERV